MPVNSVLAPFPVFLDAAGVPLENGYIYVGQPGFEARSNPKASYYDTALTIPTGTSSGAAVRTKAGVPVNTSNAPAMFYVDGDYSISVTDKNGALVFSALNNTLAINLGGAFGPVLGSDGNLSAVGIGFSNEPNTGFVRSATTTMQTVVGGVIVSQQTPTGVVFNQPVSGSGFTSGVTAIAQPVNAKLTAISSNGGVTTAEIAAATLVTASETILGNNNDTTIPTSAAVAGLNSAYLIVVDEKTSGTAGGTATSGSFQTRTLNTVKLNNITGASLATNQITLPAGTYVIEASAPAYRCDNHASRLQNITDATTTLVGTSEVTEQAGAIVSTRSHICGTFTISGSKAFEVQHRVGTTSAGSGFGAAHGYQAETYTMVKIQRIA